MRFEASRESNAPGGSRVLPNQAMHQTNAARAVTDAAFAGDPRCSTDAARTRRCKIRLHLHCRVSFLRVLHRVGPPWASRAYDAGAAAPPACCYGARRGLEERNGQEQGRRQG